MRGGMAVLEEIEGGVSPEELARSSSSNVAETSSKFFRQRSGPTAGKDLDEDLTSEWNLEDSDVDDDDNVLAEHVAFVEEPNAAELYADLQESKLSERAEWTFDFVLWCIPFAFLFELLNLLAQKQYHQESSFAGEIATLAKRLPRTYEALSAHLCSALPVYRMEYVTPAHPGLREQRRWLTQAVTFVVGTLAGCYLAYVVNKVRGTCSCIRPRTILPSHARQHSAPCGSSPSCAWTSVTRWRVWGSLALTYM